MRISDWSSDVCSSDLVNGRAYKADDLKATIKAKTSPIELLVQTGDVYRTVKLKYDGGLRYPRLKPTKKGKGRSEEHTSELQSLMRISYAVFCLKKKNK